MKNREVALLLLIAETEEEIARLYSVVAIAFKSLFLRHRGPTDISPFLFSLISLHKMYLLRSLAICASCACGATFPAGSLTISFNILVLYGRLFSITYTLARQSRSLSLVLCWLLITYDTIYDLG